jgi:dynein heavy chain
MSHSVFLLRGGNPLGPAGTGKTETVKDLGKNLAKYVVVINCSDGMDYKSVGRIFSGLVQSGSWGCFDEFNRIKVEVISVVAMQVLSIVNALSAKQPSFTFMGSTIKCNPTTGLFITMNPGYAGRTELPDNLKALMRPVAMMTPDLSMIAEVMLAAEGFRDARNLAKKTVTLYSLMIQQLSKQDHYDYGLRNLKAVLNMAGSLKRADPDMNEEAILMRALRDMNLPKFIQDDERLFRLLLGDLFPSLELPVSEHGVLQAAIDSCLMGEGLQKHPFLSGKVLQLYDSKLTRHCNMLVGSTLAGKTVAWKMLMQAMCSLNKEGQQGFMPVTPFVINPKSVTLSELYGAYDLATFEWTDGILSTIFKSCAEDSRPIEKWIVFDGPVDALWIESMNSVMDDNKILTLINGDRIPLSSTMSLVFEVEDLAVASPATVSRAGMVYMDAVEMGWKPYAQSWLQQHFGEDAEGRELHEGFFDKYVEPVLQHKAAAELREPVPICDFNAVQSLCALYDSFRFDPECEVVRDADGYHSIAEKWFVFALIWSVCAAVDEKGRCSLDIFLRDIEAQFPPSATVYDYFIDLKRRDWELWESRVASFRSWKGMPFHAMIVPTIDTTRNGYILSALCKNKRNTLIVGASGTGKTVLSASELSRLPETHSQLMINFSATTDSGTTQSMIESCMEKRSKDKIGPAGGKQLVCFIDDFNMPLRTSSESPFQPPLELLRFWMDHGGWYDRAKCTWRHVLGMQLICAMAPPGGARAEISARTQSRFNVLNVTFPGDPQVIRIFETILGTRFAELDNDIKTLSSKIAAATLRVYHSTVATFLPTPAKSHYLFNMRDPARVVEGLLQASPKVIDTQDSLLRLWAHECCRSFSDRFVADAADDESRFADIVCEQLGTFFDTDWETLHRDCDAPALGSIFSSAASLGDEGDEVEYSEHTSIGKLREAMEERLEDYNLEPKLVSMDLVLFADAVRHLCRIHRVLRLRRGSIMLVGVGGSGRQSLTRLAAFMCGCDVFSIEITKNYRRVDFREDLKALFDQTGIQGRQVVFLFNDNQVKEEGFLEDINNILQSGQVPNLYARDEIGPILDAVRKPARAAGVEETGDALWEFFVGRVRDNLHLVLAMSPVGTSFRSRCRSYPGLVNCMTIDWFQRWPADALVEVANRFISDVPMDDEAHRSKVALIFSTVHTSVVDASTKMLEEMKRHNYVTPTNYLELVKGYRTILAERRSTINDSCNKLRNGLTKLEEAREQVEVMSVELETKKVVVAKAQRDCEELLVEIVSERRIADEQKKQVEAESQKIAKEEGECKAIADDAQADLAVAMPALEKAMAEVDKLDKGSITEVKAYSKPPALVETVLSAVMVLFGKATDWGTAKQMLGRSDFLQSIKTYDKDNVANTLMNKVKKYVTNPDFEPDNVAKVSSAAATLCVWVHAIYIYSTVARDVAPKRERLKGAQELLAQKQANLKAAQEALAEVVAKVDSLKQRYDESVSQKNDLMQESQMLQEKLGRADKLVTGLAGEYARWQISIGSFELRLSQLVGDSLLAAGFLSYAGPFDTSYRASLVQAWSTAVRGAELPSADDFSFKSFLADPTDIRLWSIQGLPKDDFSAENGVMVTRSSRWPLMIDPQGQANRWVRAMEKERGLRVIDLHMKDCLRELGNCIAYGLPCLLQDVLEELDPAIEPVLSKAIIRQGNREVIRLGDKELDWSKDFRLYITTTLSNPHYTPEVSTKTTVVNFSVKQEGLEAQLLGIVVQEEEPALEEQASELTLRVAQGKKKLVDLEDEILQLLSQSSGSLLDDLALVDALQQSKTTSEEVTQQLQVAEETSLKIDAAREGYRAAAVRASIAYFVLIDLSRVDPMYQFSLDAYVNLFHGSIEESRRSQGRDEEPLTPAERCLAINTVHTLRTYRYTCRGLFERHKLLFSMQLCFQILMQQAGKVQPEEFNFLLHGGAVVDRSQEKVNPAKDWLDQSSWDNIIALDKLAGFSGLAASFEQVPREWKAWYLSGKPESSSLIGDWETRLSDLQRMCLLRALRRDRILHSAAAFVSANLGPAFADPPAFDLRAVFKDSTCRMPLIFVLSPGVDPTAQVASLASSVGVEMETVALGQGQAPTAMAMLEEGSRSGKWVFLANCHLMLSWMADLEKAVEELLIRPDLNPRFRLWLSSAPHPKFPISILQRGIKMTTEPPSGLRANLLTLYNTVTPEQFSRCGQVSKYRKLLFSLCWFHAILLERRKFKSLGFNIPYEFNESDFSICHDLIIVYLDEYVDKTPYDAMRYLIAEANYGGRVTDDWDRRLVNVYIHQFFCEAVLEEDHYPLSSLKEYFIPSDGDLASYKDVISYLPKTDHAEAFGQHPNADIVSMMEDATSLLGTMAALQPRAKAAEGESAEVRALNLAGDLLSQLPEPLKMSEVRAALNGRSDPDPLKTVLLQEVERYNLLLVRIASQLKDLQSAAKGLIAVTPELEEVMDSILSYKVPSAWGTCFPSLKLLAAWMKDLEARAGQVAEWARSGPPPVFWLPGMTYPTGFLTALLQTSARRNGIAIDTLSWDFGVLTMPEKDLTAGGSGPKEGAYCHGLFLEGAKWNKLEGCLAEPEPMQLYCEMPVIHFKPVEGRRKGAKGFYSCPIYMYPLRTGTRERPSFVIAADLKAGKMSSAFWAKRGVGLLLSTPS